MVERDEPKTLLVDVRLEDGSDASMRVRRRAEELGARIQKRWSSSVTHVVWQGGDERLRDEALRKALKVVGPGWVEASYNNGQWVSENQYLLKKHTPLSSGLRYLSDRTVFGTKRKRSKSMEPKSIENYAETSSTPALASRLRRAVGSDRTEIYTDSSKNSSVGVTSCLKTLATATKQKKKRIAFDCRDRPSVSEDDAETLQQQQQQQQQQPPEVIVIDDDDDDSPVQPVAPRDRASVAGNVMDATEDEPKSAAPPRQHQLHANGVFSARDRYWDDDEEGDSFFRRRRRSASRRNDSTALDLDAKLAEVVSPPRVQEAKLISTDTSEDEDVVDEAAPPKKRMRFSFPDDDDDADEKKDDDRRTATTNTPRRRSSIGRHENAENTQMMTTTTTSSLSPLYLVEEHRSQSLLVSGSGIDGAARQTLKSLCARIKFPKARFVDNEVWMRMTGAAPPKATHLVVGAQRLDGGPRTLKVLFALARGGTAIVTPEWVFASQKRAAWLDTSNFLAGFGAPRPTGTKILEQSLKIHVLSTALGSSDPARGALEALVKAAGGTPTKKQREATVVLVGAEFTLSRANATLRALARKVSVVKTRWLFDVIERNDPHLSKRPYLLSGSV